MSDSKCTPRAVLGTLFLVAIKDSSEFGNVNITLAFWCFSLALNVLATALIVGRLVYYRFKLQGVLGSQHAVQYTSIIAMIVESELLYTAYLIIYIVPFILNNPVVNAITQAPSVVQVRVTSASHHVYSVLIFFIICSPCPR